ncbi:hypothetical protein ACJJIQ_02065 [Microbulbifer sp. ANSA003]|uniref:hypothetical protein n=1 Tax=Microbulbifer sp. ANSA003 TaxID=3243360 RepID=UPI00404204A1
MAFDIDKLTFFCENTLEGFTKEHPEEKICGFGIDESYIYINSLSTFAATIQKYSDDWAHSTRAVTSLTDLSDSELSDAQFAYDLINRNLKNQGKYPVPLDWISKARTIEREKGNPYKKPDKIDEIYRESASWGYPEVACFREEDGFDYDALETYDMLDVDDQPASEFAQAMNQLMIRLKHSPIFNQLKGTDNFVLCWAGHNH